MSFFFVVVYVIFYDFKKIKKKTVGASERSVKACTNSSNVDSSYTTSEAITTSNGGARCWHEEPLEDLNVWFFE